MNNLRQKVFRIINVAEQGDRASKVFDIFIFTLIILNVIASVIETIESAERYSAFFYYFEVVSVAVFTIEYILRVWSCVEDPEFSGPLKGRIKFLFTPLIIIDLLAIAPFYLPMLIPMDLRFLRVLRLFRIFRLLKLARYVESMKIMAAVMRSRKEELSITLFVGVVLLLIASSLMYHVEHDHQPEIFSSIPMAMWWGVCTMTTVGYGDIIPATTIGKIIASMISVLGIGMFALPAGILGSGFMEEVASRKKKKTVCPHCGKSLDA